MKNLRKLSRNELKELNGGKLAPNLGGGINEGGWCGAPCDSKCVYPAKCMSCQNDNGQWDSHCRS